MGLLRRLQVRVHEDWGVDVGVLYYWYPGDLLDGVTKPNTTELYIAGNWKWVSLKYSHAVSDTFGIPDSHNSWYLDLSANYPLTETWTLNTHVGRQEYKGSTNGFNNGDNSTTPTGRSASPMRRPAAELRRVLHRFDREGRRLHAGWPEHRQGDRHGVRAKDVLTGDQP